MMFATLRRAPRGVFPMNCKDDRRPPRAGRLELQLVSGVSTFRLQLVNNEERI
jgi:hypothetical protein